MLPVAAWMRKKTPIASTPTARWPRSGTISSVVAARIMNTAATTLPVKNGFVGSCGKAATSVW